MNRIALGTAQFGLDYGIANQAGKVPVEIVKLMLDFAKDNAIDTIDTAIAYGSSEECLGQFLLDSFRIVTKIPKIDPRVSNIGLFIDELLNSSFDRLNTNQVYGLLLHSPGDLLSSFGHDLYTALVKLKEEGKVRKIGVSVYDPSELELLCPRFKFDLVQAPFNIVDRRLSESGWLARLKDADVEIHTRSAFLQGLLLMNSASIPCKFKKWDFIWNLWHRWLSDRNFSALTACLGFTLSYPEIDRVVIGADNLPHLKQINEASKATKPDEFPEIGCYDQDLINPSRWSFI